MLFREQKNYLSLQVLWAAPLMNYMDEKRSDFYGKAVQRATQADVCRRN